MKLVTIGLVAFEKVFVTDIPLEFWVKGQRMILTYCIHKASCTHLRQH